MFVCVCHAVTDREVERTIEGGARSREAVTRACRAGGDCGACHQTIEDMIECHDHQRDSAGAVDERLVAAASLVRERAA
jgi:bacterioferritin-associated ferredoxin